MLSRRELLRLVPAGAATGLACWAVTSLDAPGTAAPAPAAAGGGTPTGWPETTGTVTPTTPGSTAKATATAKGTTTAQPADKAAAFREAMTSYRKPAAVTFGVAIHNARTDETYSYKGSTLFETASIVKADILSVLLLQAQDDGDTLTRSQRSLASVMIRISDNNAASALWRQAGGASGIRKANKRLGLEDTVTTTASWGLTRTTPSDQVRLLDTLSGDSDVLTSASRAYALGLMGDVNSAQDWGVPSIARAGEKAAVKNGWLPRSKDGYRWIVNSIGRVTGPEVDLRVAVLSRGNAGQGSGIRLVEAVAQRARETLGW